MKYILIYHVSDGECLIANVNKQKYTYWGVRERVPSKYVYRYSELDDFLGAWKVGVESGRLTISEHNSKKQVEETLLSYAVLRELKK